MGPGGATGVGMEVRRVCVPAPWDLDLCGDQMTQISKETLFPTGAGCCRVLRGMPQDSLCHHLFFSHGKCTAQPWWFYIYILLTKKSSAEVSSRAGGTAPRSDVSLSCPRLCACLQWSWQGWGQGAVHRASPLGAGIGSSLGSVVRSAGWCLLPGSWPALGARGMGALRGAVSGG